MRSISQLVLPPKELASCVTGCLYRNTLGVDLTDEERRNCFPASPLFAASAMLSGELHAADPSTPPVDLAVEAGFADQSHMGRDLKRATGFSPVQLNQRILQNEAFWCYRLLGERF